MLCFPTGTKVVVMSYYSLTILDILLKLQPFLTAGYARIPHADIILTLVKLTYSIFFLFISASELRYKHI